MMQRKLKLTELTPKIHLPFKAGDRIGGLKLRGIRNSNNHRIAAECGEDEAFYIVHAANNFQSLLSAAEHLSDCEFAGQSIEFRCPRCIEGRAAIARAQEVKEP